MKQTTTNRAIRTTCKTRTKTINTIIPTNQNTSNTQNNLKIEHIQEVKEIQRIKTNGTKRKIHDQPTFKKRQ